MAGKITHTRDWASKEGGWEPPIKLKRGAQSGLEKALGRALTADEIVGIEKALARIRFVKTGFPEATSQDVKRTLGNIGRLQPGEAITAYRRSDSTTTALIDEAMVFSLDIQPDSLEFHRPSGENIVKAAKAAVAELNRGKGWKGGRPSKNHYRVPLADYAIALWARLGGGDCKAWRWDDASTPIVHFMAHLSSAVDDEVLDLSSAVKLLKGAAGH